MEQREEWGQREGFNVAEEDTTRSDELGRVGDANTSNAGVLDNDFKNDFEDDFNDDFNDDFENDFKNDFNDDFNDDSDEPENPDNSFDVNGNILTSTVVNDAETEVDLSIDELASGVFAVETEEPSEEDDADFELALGTLRKVGYEGIDDCDYETLEKLLQREHTVVVAKEENCDSRQIFSELLNYAVDWVSTSNATLYAGDSEDNLKYLRDNYAYVVDDKVFSAIDSIVYKAAQQQSDIDLDDVYNDIIFSGLVDVNDPAVQDVIHNYIQQVVPSLVQLERNRSFKVENKSKARYRIAQRLLGEEEQLIQKMKGTPKEKVRLSRCFDFFEGKLRTKCPVCGEEVSVDRLPISIVSVPSSKVGQLETCNVFLPIFCGSCEAAITLTLEEYESLVKFAMESYRLHSTRKDSTTLLGLATKQESTLCVGATAVKIIPVLNTLIDCLPELIHEHGVENVENTEQIADDKVSTNVIYEVNDLEYKEAVKEFYTRLNMFRQKHKTEAVDSDSGAQSVDPAPAVNESIIQQFIGGSSQTNAITPRQIAAYMLQQLSLDYTTEKNKAIYSLIYYFQDNPILAKMLDLSRIWDLKDNMQIVAGLTEKSIEFISSEKKLILLELRQLLSAEYNIQWDYDKTEKEQLLELIEMLPAVSKLLEQYQLEREEAVRFLEANKDAFGYCKLINSSTMKLSSLENYLDKRSAEAIDHITDLMLINGYAEKFFDVWKTFGILQYKTVVDALTVSTSMVHSYNAIVSKLEKALEKQNICYRFDKEYFGIFNLPINEEHQKLREAYGALQSNNFYRFCKAVQQIPLDVKSRVSYPLTISMQESIKKIKEIDDTANKSEAEYFLRDFTKEELQTSTMDLDLLTFNGLVPRRKEEESIDQYVKRYKELQQSGEYDMKDVWNSADLFNSVRAEALVIATSAILSSAEYKSFSTAMFISRSIGSLLSLDSSRAIEYFLNITDEIYNLNEAITPYFNYDAMGLEHTEAYYRVVTGYYLSTASNFVKSLSYGYDNAVLHAEVSLEDEMKGQQKLERLHQLFCTIQEAKDEELSDTETMFNEIAEKCCDDQVLRKDLEGFN